MTGEIWTISESGSFVVEIELMMQHKLTTRYGSSEDGDPAEVLKINR